MKNNSSKWGLLINPFEKIAGWKAFGIGAIIIVVTVVIGHACGLRFASLLGFKYPSSLSLSDALLCQWIGLLPTILLIYLSGLFFSKKTRFQDAVGVVALSRFPYLIPVLFCFVLERIPEGSLLGSVIKVIHPANYLGRLFLLVLILIFAIWVITLLYNGFKVSTNIKGAKGTVVFIGVVVLSEVLSNSIMFLLSR